VASISNIKKYTGTERLAFCGKQDKNGRCQCQFYRGHVSAENVVNIEVDCGKLNRTVNGKVAQKCFKDRSPQELITPSTG
jgi:hypothetical protein